MRLLNQILLTCLLLVFVRQTNTKIFSECELETQLLAKKVPASELGNWICWAKTVSSLNSSLLLPSSKHLKEEHVNYGIFQINDHSWCSKTGEDANKSGCKIYCIDLLDDDLSDDIECAFHIYNESQRDRSKWDEHQQCKYVNSDQFISACGNSVKGFTNNLKTPTILNLQNGTTKTFKMSKEDLHLLCEADGNPTPTLIWDFNRTKFPNSYSIPSSNGLSLFIPTSNMSLSIEEDFTCEAINNLGKSKIIIRVKILAKDVESPSSGFTFGLVAGIALNTLIVALIIGVLRCRRANKSKSKQIQIKGLTTEEIAEFKNGDPDGLIFNAFAHENARFQPYNKEYEILDDQLTIQTDKLLGSGAFGLVYKGLVDGKIVAVKTIKPCADKIYIKALLSELKVMIYIGKHENIVNLIGAKTTELDKGSLHIIVEFCDMGSLETYIRNNKSNFVDLNGVDNIYSNVGQLNITMPYANVGNFFTSQDMLVWSYQIASGMKYLASRRVIHGDLATRNILLSDKTHLKITDFGLSRQLYDYTNYVKKQQAPLPWRWMAIESLRSMTFSHQSDVWAFAVTLWEIFSLGEVPYPGLSWSLEFVTQLEQGLRLLKPKYCSFEMYERLVACWHLIPSERPDISSMYEWLKLLLEHSDSGNQT